jgi:hypothetical protein
MIARRACAREANRYLETSSRLNYAQSDSAGDLSWHDPVLPVDCSMPWELHNRRNSRDMYWADSTGRRNTSIMECAVGRKTGWMVTTAGRPAVRKRNRQKDIRIYRGQIPSPGAPTIAWREDRVRFWAAIAQGSKTDVAGIEAGISSPVAYRWFRQTGGVNPSLPPTVSGRYLSFAEREDIAIWRAQKLGVREIARRSNPEPLDDLSRAAPQRVDEGISTDL